MRPREHELIDPAIAEQLDAVDATLAGEPVAPRFAELAELALMVAAERPVGPSPEFAAELDRRVQARFGRSDPSALGSPVPSAGGGPAREGGGRARGGGGRRWWGLTPPMFGGAASALAAAVVALVVLTSSGGSGPAGNRVVNTTVRSAPAPTTAATSTAGTAIAGTSPHGSAGAKTASPARAGAGVKAAVPAASAPAPEPRAPALVPTRPPPRVPAGSVNSSAAGSTTSAGSINGTPAPAPLPNGRKIVQSSMLDLGARAGRIDAVAQEIFNVVRLVNGIVDSSNVSSAAGPGGYAEFQLRVPSSLLPFALTQLSRLRYANVISRSDATRDVNGSYLSTERQIAAARAALSRLPVATLESQILSLRAQIASEQATLARAQGSLTSLNRQIDYSRVEVSVETTPAPVPPSGGGGFGVGKAGHDALRVLEVTAGVALIVLAALVPIALIAALAWWVAVTTQRRRRERALDLA